ncbi:hypothetical protein [Lacipirellula parvula]|uniref:Uncharacterized protein n=1 Tax=Lacipirellula parvula TaxID=2650471 RepID=A0A5K7XHP6_9BACT|nr:hypothetical protein [Lacipirellula parvula]BBO34481.1 hypothetical protein PLANPX_4093 [Lacipirellula parvula]
MIRLRRRFIAAAALAATASFSPLHAQQTTTTYEVRDGVQYAVTKQQVAVQVPVYENRSQEQTTYRQQITTENVQHQQVYHVPVTQYQVVTTIHNRWNPFAEAYATHHYEPVTTWQQQVGTVQIPVQRVSVVPETRTVQQQVPTSYKTVYNTVTSERVVGMAPTGTGQNTMMAASQPTSSSWTAASPQATAATNPSASLQQVTSPAVQQPAARVAANPYGGQQLTSDPPRSGYTQPAAASPYQPAATVPPTQTATQPSPAPAASQPYSRY